MISKSFYLLISLFITVSLFAQTPEQSYFEWTSLPFSKEELAQRRNQFIDILQKQGKTGLVLIPAKDGFSYGETFRQLNDFYYFTGLELPNAILVLDLATESAIVYVPERDLRFENGSRRNDFPGRPLLFDQEIAIKSGLLLKSMEAFSTLLIAKAETETSILVNNGRQGAIAFLSDEYVSTPSPVQILLLGISRNNAVCQLLYIVKGYAWFNEIDNLVSYTNFHCKDFFLPVRKFTRYRESPAYITYIMTILATDIKDH